MFDGHLTQDLGMKGNVQRTHQGQGVICVELPRSNQAELHSGRGNIMCKGTKAREKAILDGKCQSVGSTLEPGDRGQRSCG